MATRSDLSEEIVHRSFGLPLKIYETGGVYYHWHDEYEFVYSTSSRVQCVVNGQHITLEPDMALLIQSGDLHMLRTEPTTNMTVIVAHPTFWADDQDLELFRGKLTFQNCFTKDDPVGSFIVESLKRIAECYRQKGLGYEFRLKSLFSGIFAALMEHHMYTQAETNKFNNSVSAMLIYIHQHYDQKLTLDQLSDHFHYSKSYIIRLFNQNIGETPVEYIKRYRLEKAKETLSNTKLSILETAIACGFSNVGYFIRSFKEQNGYTPSQYRKHHSATNP